MFRLATVPTLGLRPRSRPTSVGAGPRTAAAARPERQAASADVRIRRFESGSVHEDSYMTIIPDDKPTPAQLLRIITDACKDLPEFQIQSEEDEQFILTLTLKG